MGHLDKWTLPDKPASYGRGNGPAHVQSNMGPPPKQRSRAPSQDHREAGAQRDRDGKRMRTSGYHESQPQASRVSYQTRTSGYHEPKTRVLGDSYRPKASGHHESRPKYSGNGGQMRTSGYNEPRPQPRYGDGKQPGTSGYHDSRAYPSRGGDPMSISGYHGSGPSSYVNQFPPSHYNIPRSGVNPSAGAYRLQAMGCQIHLKEVFSVGQVRSSMLLLYVPQ